MDIKKYKKFELRLHQRGEEFKVELLDSPSGKMTGEWQKFPLELKTYSNKLEKRGLKEKEIIQLGQTLADIILPNKKSKDIRHLYHSSLENLRSDEGLRLVLILDSSPASFPWEYLHLSDCETGFLAMHNQISIVRRELVPSSYKEDRTSKTRRILVACASPKSQNKLQAYKDYNHIEEALRNIPKIHLIFFTNTTSEELQSGLFEGIDIFHFAGHGEFNDESGVVIYLVAEDEDKFTIESNKLAKKLHDANVQLVVLSACETGRRNDLNNGMVGKLVKAGIPAIVAMQYEITDENAITFTKAFYKALAIGMPLDKAVSKGRHAIDSKYNNAEEKYWRDWGCPVLYWQVDGDFFLRAIDDENECKSLEEDLEKSIDIPPYINWHLPIYIPIYEEDKAEQKLYESLKNGEFCYVLTSPRMDKSSLREKTMQILQAEGISCAAISLTNIDGRRAPEDFNDDDKSWWYFHFYQTIFQGFDLDRLKDIDTRSWWYDYNKTLSPVNRLARFIKVVLLKQDRDIQAQQFIIFVDEIESVLRLSFPPHDFFDLLRYCYNQRTSKPKYRQLSFVLLGEAIDSRLMQNVSNQYSLIREVLEWTGGQPFLTQQIFQLINLAEDPIPDASEEEWVRNLIQTQVIDNWEADRYLKWIRDRLLQSQPDPTNILQLYKQILQNAELEVNDSLEQEKLIDLGLVVKQQEKLKVYNKIYESVFNDDWIDSELELLNPQPNICQPEEFEELGDVVEPPSNGNIPDTQDNYTSELYPGQTYLTFRETTDYQTRLKIFWIGLQNSNWRILKKRLLNYILLLFKRYRLFKFPILLVVGVLSVTTLPQVANTPNLPIGLTPAETQAFEKKASEALDKFESKELDALLDAVQIGEILKKRLGNSPRKEYRVIQPLFALQYIRNNIYEKNQIKEHDAPVRTVSFSPKGNFLASAGEDGIIRLCSFSDKTLPCIHASHESDNDSNSNVRNLIFNPVFHSDKSTLTNQQNIDDLLLLATAGENGKIRFWNQSLKPIGSPLQAYDTGELTNMSFSSDGKFIVTAGGPQGNQVKLWDVKSRREIASLDRLGFVNSLSFNPNPSNEWFVTADIDGLVQFWNKSGNEIPPSLSTSTELGEINSVSFSPNGETLATAGEKGVKLWDSLNNDPKSRQFGTGKGGVRSVRFSQDGKWIATAGESGKVHIWKLTADESKHLSVKAAAELDGHDKPVNSVSFEFEPNLQNLATGGDDDTVRIWKLSELEKKPFLDLKERIRSIDIGLNSDNRQRLAILKEDGTVTIRGIDFENEEIIWECRNKIVSMSLGPDKKYLAAIGTDGAVEICDFSGDRSMNKPIENFHKVTKIAFIRKSFVTLSVTLEEDGTAKLWYSSGSPGIPLNSRDKVRTVSFRSDGERIATGAEDGTVKLWDNSGEKIKESAHLNNDGVILVKFSPDGKLIAAVGNDHTLKLWDYSNNQVFELDTTDVTTTNFSKNEQLIATGGNNGVVSIWNLSRKKIAEFNGDWDKTVSVVFREEKNKQLEIFAAGDNGKIQRWPIKGLEQLLKDGCEWLEEYFNTHPKEKEKRDICSTS